MVEFLAQMSPQQGVNQGVGLIMLLGAVLVLAGIVYAIYEIQVHKNYFVAGGVVFCILLFALGPTLVNVLVSSISGMNMHITPMSPQ